MEETARRPITIHSRVEDGFAVVEVRDAAGGIPADCLDRVFEPLYSTRAFGSGLGLPITRRIVEEAGGAPGIASEPGRGTRVTLRLAAVAAAGPA